MKALGPPRFTLKAQQHKPRSAMDHADGPLPGIAARDGGVANEMLKPNSPLLILSMARKGSAVSASRGRTVTVERNARTCSCSFVERAIATPSMSSKIVGAATVIASLNPLGRMMREVRRQKTDTRCWELPRRSISSDVGCGSITRRRRYEMGNEAIPRYGPLGE